MTQCASNVTSSSTQEDVCGGRGPCISDVLSSTGAVCVCPNRYAIETDCEFTHHGLYPDFAFVIGLVTMILFALLSVLYIFEYVWSFTRRPQARLSLLQLFKLVFVYLCLTRAYLGFDMLVNAMIGETVVWGIAVSQFAWCTGLAALLFSMAMVVSLWYDMVLKIRNINVETARSSYRVRWGLIIGGIIMSVMVVGVGIYNIFQRPLWSIFSLFFAILYAIAFFIIAGISIHLSRHIWCRKGASKSESRAIKEFSKKVKIIIGWEFFGVSYILSSILFTVLPPDSLFYMYSYMIFFICEFGLAALSLVFGQHYLYPFRGWGCSKLDGKSSRSTSHKVNSRFSMSKGGKSLPVEPVLDKSTNQDHTSVSAAASKSPSNSPSPSSSPAPSVSSPQISVSIPSTSQTPSLQSSATSSVSISSSAPLEG